jgi:MoaA/NifB/PqqE/SkfB family radical SAM enzyme
MEIEITSTLNIKCPHCYRTFQKEVTLTDDIEIDYPERDEL